MRLIFIATVSVVAANFVGLLAGLLALTFFEFHVMEVIAILKVTKALNRTQDNNATHANPSG
ncbi:MAG: hypothetical protein OSA89_18090 [Mariniblastus sp.]|nr:hypothetical protein [Mariniblastus sp.]